MARARFPAHRFFPSANAGKRGFSLLPFRFDRLPDGRERLVNEVGESAVLPPGTVRALLEGGIAPGSDIYRALRARQFLLESLESPQLDILATKYRTKNSHMDEFTQLHMFVITLRCDQACQYCQVSRVGAESDKSRFDMSLDTADRSIDLMFESPARHIVIEFQGGEPTLNFATIQYLVERGRSLEASKGKDLRIVLTSNAASLSDDQLAFMNNHRVCLSTSLDGPVHVHNQNRPRIHENSYDLAVRGIDRARAALGFENVHALMTTSKYSLGYPNEIVDEYVARGFRSIFLRRLNPYGFAAKPQPLGGYTPEEFLDFYRAALDHILALNLQGVYFEEVFAKILLTKILTPFPSSFVDVQSPSGAGIKCVVYNYDGRVYASDEARMLAEMGDDSFLLGDVHTDSYEAIFSGPAIRALTSISVNQSLPGCSDCAYQVFCGADPIRSYTTQRDVYGHRPTSEFCRVNLAVIRHLFDLLENRKELKPIFMAWIRQHPVDECLMASGVRLQ